MLTVKNVKKRDRAFLFIIGQTTKFDQIIDIQRVGLLLRLVVFLLLSLLRCIFVGRRDALPDHMIFITKDGIDFDALVYLAHGLDY